MSSKDSEARRRAEEKFVKARQREDDVMNSQRQLQQAEAAKLVRLRALRMAKEAAEKQAAELVPHLRLGRETANPWPCLLGGPS